MQHTKLLLGKGKKILTKSEEEAEHHISFRRSIYASRSIKIGEVLTEDNLTVLRPFHGICASRFDDILGCIATRDIDTCEVLNENDLVKK